MSCINYQSRIGNWGRTVILYTQTCCAGCCWIIGRWRPQRIDAAEGESIPHKSDGSQQPESIPGWLDDVLIVIWWLLTVSSSWDEETLVDPASEEAEGSLRLPEDPVTTMMAMMWCNTVRYIITYTQQLVDRPSKGSLPTLDRSTRNQRVARSTEMVPGIFV